MVPDSLPCPVNSAACMHACAHFGGDAGTTKSLPGRGLEPSHLKEHALDMAEGTQHLLV